MVKFVIALPDIVNVVSMFCDSKEIKGKVLFLLFLVGVAYILLHLSIGFSRKEKIEDAKEEVVYKGM